eukprot:232556-Hanusia_phi.AAC.4
MSAIPPPYQHAASTTGRKKTFSPPTCLLPRQKGCTTRTSRRRCHLQPGRGDTDKQGGRWRASSTDLSTKSTSMSWRPSSLSSLRTTGRPSSGIRCGLSRRGAHDVETPRGSRRSWRATSVSSPSTGRSELISARPAQADHAGEAFACEGQEGEARGESDEKRGGGGGGLGGDDNFAGNQASRSPGSSGCTASGQTRKPCSPCLTITDSGASSCGEAAAEGEGGSELRACWADRRSDPTAAGGAGSNSPCRSPACCQGSTQAAGGRYRSAQGGR